MKKSTAPLALALILSACGGGEQQPQQAPQGPPQVGFVTVRTEPVTLTTQLPGRTAAFETSEVRPQVNGLILARLFQEGDYVRRGQPLYRIDPAPYQAAVASARAALTRAQAAIASTRNLARRYGELVKINAISRQEFENATTTAQQAEADIAAQRAALRQAQIDLSRTTITAPISGRIGRSVSTTGALVSAAQTEALTTIQRLDPVYVDIQQSSADVLKLRQQLMGGDLSRGAAASRVRLKLEDGSTYPIEGTLRFTDVTVDPATGTQVIRAVFANPRGLLLPGMYVRAELVEGTQGDGILVPQRAVTRDPKGNATAMVIGQDGKLSPRPLTTSRTVGDAWLVTGGLKPGDKVVIEGAMNLQPGTPVKGYPWTPQTAGQAPQGAAAPAGGAPASQAQAK
ncbi:hemolysin D [Sphingomonas sp. Leaf407]|uniref:efflux RND transporter periplasmic adaptor subunit n=1 Tax=unclassified Sphingomonas TaxID=196159 RepID=UPI0006F3BD45|nr:MULTISPECIES: efflux RND transporter periplasmic adaptor subunit [unclassified Sphingomonas]KQN34802.1 hemolysin D [Sphingomonas sp. Leaf42]KQT25354.1 hemolysin D [Sphingomonas sp. Leaf407]